MVMPVALFFFLLLLLLFGTRCEPGGALDECTHALKVTPVCRVVCAVTSGRSATARTKLFLFAEFAPLTAAIDRSSALRRYAAHVKRNCSENGAITAAGRPRRQQAGSSSMI